MSSPLEVLGALSDRGESVRLLLDSLQARVATVLGAPVQVRAVSMRAMVRDAAFRSTGGPPSFLARSILHHDWNAQCAISNIVRYRTLTPINGSPVK